MNRFKLTSKTGTFEYPLAFMSAESEETLDVVLVTYDIRSVRDNFTDISLIEVFDSDGLITYSSTDYCTILGTIELKMDYWINPETNAYEDGVKIVLKKVDLDEKWKRLDAQINPVIDETTMTLEEYQEYWIGKIGKDCEKTIFSGTDVTLSDGSVEHFSYTIRDQLNILELFNVSTSTKLPCPYHQDESHCTIYSVNDVATIYISLAGFKLYHTTYANALNTYVRSLTDKAEISKVFYGMDVPDCCKEFFNAALEQGKLVINAICGK